MKIKLNPVYTNTARAQAVAIVNKYAGLVSKKYLDSTVYFTVKDVELDEAVGIVGFRPLNNHTVEQVHTVILPSHRNKGYGKAASSLLEQLLFAKGYNKVYCTVNTANTAMIKIKESLGFVREGVLRSHFVPGRDVCVFSKLASESRR